MSVLQTRGGIPDVFRDTINTTGREHKLPFSCSGIVARNKGANIVRLYFSLADYTADVNYVELPVAAATAPHGEWTGPVEANQIWLRAALATSDVEVVTFQRRG